MRKNNEAKIEYWGAPVATLAQEEVFSFNTTLCFGCLKILSFFTGFLSRTFMIHRTVGEGRGYFLRSSLLLPLASKILKHQPGDYYRALTSVYSQQPDSTWEPLLSKRKSLTTKLRTLRIIKYCVDVPNTPFCTNLNRTLSGQTLSKAFEIKTYCIFIYFI